MPPKARARPAALHLVYLALIVALPLVLLIGALLWRASSLEREQVDHRLKQVLEALVADLDRDFDRHTTILRTLASSPLLAAENWPAFYEQARSALQGKGYIILIDPEGRQVVNTYVPYGQAPQTTGDPETLRRIRDVHRPVASDLFVSKVAKELVYNVSIPVMRGENLRFVMSIGLLPSDVTAILKEQGLSEPWSLVVWDANGSLLARSREDGGAIGSPVPEALRSLLPGRVTRTAVAWGEDAFVVAGESAWSGWRVAVLFPAAAIEQQARRSLQLWVATIVLVGGIVAALAWYFGREMTRPLAAATQAARALGRGQKVVSTPSRIAEINEVNDALLRAQQEVAASSAALRRSEEQLRTAAEAAEFGAHEYDVANDRTHRSLQFMKILGASEGEETATFAAGLDWVHPDDRERTQAAKRAILEGRERRYQIEYRIRRRDGTVRWVMDRGQVVRDARSGRALRVIGVVLDITDMKAAEERQRLLFEELNHRVKNTLTIVQSLAKQTLRTKTDPREFAAAFDARLQSLATAHNLLTRGSWLGAPLKDIVEAALHPFEDDQRRISIEGGLVAVPAESTVALSLMFHELATNAAKYGALSSPGGTLAIRWEVTEGPTSLAVVLSWVESDGPPVVAPLTSGFGSRLLQGTARQLGGSVDLEFAPNGLHCTIRFAVRKASMTPASAARAG